MKARIEVDIWFDVDNWTEAEFKDVIEDAIDAYNGSADVRAIKLVPDEDEAPVQFVIGYLDFDGFEHKITETGYDDKGKYYDIITKSGGVHRVWDSYVMVTNVQLH